MNILVSDEYKKVLLSEFKFSIKKYRESKDLRDKLYFYSAFPGTINRIINFEFSETLLFIHNILQLTHTAFSQRLSAIQAGEQTIKITDEMIEQLIFLIEKLCECIENNKPVDDVLLKLTKLSFATSGNGNYLFQKGVFKITK